MYDARIALCDEWKSRFSFVLDWITLSRAWCATRARRSSRLAVLRPPDEKERRRPDNPDIEITCYREEEGGGGGGGQPLGTATVCRGAWFVGQRRGRRRRVHVMRAGEGTQHRASVVPGSTLWWSRGHVVPTARRRVRHGARQHGVEQRRRRRHRVHVTRAGALGWTQRASKRRHHPDGQYGQVTLT